MINLQHSQGDYDMYYFASAYNTKHMYRDLTSYNKTHKFLENIHFQTRESNQSLRQTRSTEIKCYTMVLLFSIRITLQMARLSLSANIGHFNHLIKIYFGIHYYFYRKYYQLPGLLLSQ